MDKDLKDLINIVEKETKTRAELESIIYSLKEEINRLKFRIKEQHLLIEEQGDQISFTQNDLPSEINILKEMINSQRKDLSRKDEKIDKLNEKIDGLTSQVEKPKNGTFEPQKNELIEAQELILKLSEENEKYRNQIEDLKNQLETIESENIDLEETNKAQIGKNEEMVNIKRLNFQLMEQNGLLRVEIESLKAQIQEGVEELVSEELELANKKIDNLTSEIDSLNAQLQERIKKVNSEELELANKRIEDLTSEIETLNVKIQERIEEVNSEELELANRKIEALKLEIEDYDAQLKFLQKELENSIEPTTISTEQALEFAKMREQYDNIKSELLKYQKENELLNNKLLELETQAIELIDVESSTNSFAYDFPDHFQISLFKRMYRLMSDNNKKVIINTLIKDLNSKNNEIKRCAIKILSEIKDKKVYDAFLELIHDDDWLIRYNLIKALSKFDFESEEFKKLLKKLLNDADVDVRELAAKMLNEISN
ncbi:MAG: HEAT repeat domain-containing protein [Candidatus Hodarchaeota archaeon]